MLEYSTIVKLLTEHHLEFLSLKGGCRGSSKSTHVKMPHCWKSQALAHLLLQKKKTNDEHQVDSENGKKGGKKEGVIQEETISEEGYSDEQEPSVEGL